MMGGPLGRHHNHEKESRRRFAFLNAKMSWPPPLSHDSVLAALIALLKEPESEPEPIEALAATKVEPYDSPGLRLIEAN